MGKRQMKFKLAVDSLCLCLITVYVIITSILESKSSQYVYPISRQIQYSFAIQNRTNKLIGNAEFRTHAPVKMTPTQLLVALTTTYPYDILTDNKGNQILHFAFDNFPPYTTKIITIKADLKLSNIPNKIETEDLKTFLQDELYCQSAHPEICRIAAELMTPEGITTAENIFNWVAVSTDYTGYQSNPHGALYALENKKGDCTEFMYLFTALCRANRIPARCIAGYICNKNTVIIT